MHLRCRATASNRTGARSTRPVFSQLLDHLHGDCHLPARLLVARWFSYRRLLGRRLMSWWLLLRRLLLSRLMHGLLISLRRDRWWGHFTVGSSSKFSVDAELIHSSNTHKAIITHVYQGPDVYC